MDTDTEKGAMSVIETSESTQTASSRRVSKEDATIVEVERDTGEVQQDEVELYNPHIDVSGVDEKKPGPNGSLQSYGSMMGVNRRRVSGRRSSPRWKMRWGALLSRMETADPELVFRPGS